MPIDFSVFQKAARAVEEGQANAFTSLVGSSGALLFSMLRTPCLLLCSSEEKANEFHSDAVFWSALTGMEKPLFVPSRDNSRHFKNLSEIYSSFPTKVVATVDSSILPLWEKDKFPSLEISRGHMIERDAILNKLYSQGYHSVPMVSTEGEISERGGILDIFSPDQAQPVRVEYFGDEIVSLRIFDVDTQLSVEEINSFRISPLIEPEEGPSLIDLLSDHVFILNEPDDIKKYFPDLYQAFADKKTIYFSSLALEGEGYNLSIRSIAGFGLLREERKNLEEFVERARILQHDYFVIMICSSEGQAKRLKELFHDQEVDIPILKGGQVMTYGQNIAITTGELSKGFAFNGSIILAEIDIFGKRPAYRPIKKSRVSKLISSIEDFNKGDYIVHVDHGIGKFLCIQKERIEDYEDDFITIEYLGGDRLFVPLENINYVQKYHAPENVKPKIDKLGGRTWQRTKKRVKQKIKDMAERLIKIYARRTTTSGTAFSADTELHREFDGFFPYEETPDQLTSIIEIKRDMEKPVPMDRLLCGDVGYGKTEVVMRACFKAVFDSRQVALLVPTTILAEQHYETFTSRFAAFPVNIDFLSRFKTRVEQKQALEKLAAGQTDIVIGTHRLLGKDVRFFALGLLVIDEEHKFGVTHKEKIKALKSNVDVLSLSATPIPRTLHMALSGIRGMSTIETPPEDRLAVQSIVARFNPSLIKKALEKELDRNGQAFFVHNRIQDIYNMANFLRELVPNCIIGVAHGQMKERELEQVMRAFFSNEIDVLVSTAIIGSGLDIPSANTIIINRADRFGLADLYQLRGRVGRSDINAYAYFLIPGEDIITEEARKKLQAIQELGYLGAGFRLALKDLEIRGSGNLLGSEQSGHIEAVGFDMYLEMLETAVAELKGEKITPEIEPVIDLRITAVIPDDYIENADLRLSIYRKIATSKNIKALRNIIDELRDRFGPPPEKTRCLIQIMEIKVMAARLFIKKIRNISGKIRIFFSTDTPVRPEEIFSLYKKRKGYMKFLPEGGIELDLRGKKWRDIFRELKEVMNELGSVKSQDSQHSE